MIDERTEEQASLYSLDLLEGQERKAFEHHMRESPELQRFVRELRESLYAPAKAGYAPERPEILDRVLHRIQPNPVEEPSRAKASSGGRTVPWSVIWAAAALLFLGLNLFLLFLLNERSAASAREMASVTANGEQVRANEAGRIQALPSEDSSRLEARITRLRDALAERETALAEAARERATLAEENARFREHNEGWRREYVRLAARLLPFFEPNERMSRFTVIEMVDQDAFREDLPPRGFADLAGRFLTGEGNIVGVSPEDFVGPVVEGASPSLDSATSSLTPVARGNPDFSYEDFELNKETLPGNESDSSGSSPDRPAGFTVWRDDEQKGFLDLYNLPVAEEGSKPYLWVRSSELEPYLPIGELPQLENGTGSMFYSVDEPNFTPTEILITAEPEAGPAEEPSGTILLRGP